MASYVTKTIDDAVLEARLLVNDTFAGSQRNPDSVFIQYINTALRAVYSFRPDAFIGNFSTGVISTALCPTYTTADLQVINGAANPTPPSPATPFPCDDRLFFDPVVSFVAARIEIADDEYAEGVSPQMPSSRATSLMTAFLQNLKGA